MTNQEAIEILREKISPCVTGDWKEAVGVAISALQAQEVKHSTESSLTQKALDTISRQAAIDAFEPTTFTKNEIVRRLSELQSVQPEINCSEIPNGWIPCTPETMPEKDGMIV